MATIKRPEMQARTLINEREAAEMLDVSVSFLQSDRVTRRHGIPYIKVGRSIKYRPETLLAWLEERTIDYGVSA